MHCIRVLFFIVLNITTIRIGYTRFVDIRNAERPQDFGPNRTRIRRVSVLTPSQTTTSSRGRFGRGSIECRPQTVWSVRVFLVGRRFFFSFSPSNAPETTSAETGSENSKRRADAHESVQKRYASSRVQRLMTSVERRSATHRQTARSVRFSEYRPS